VRLKFPNLNYKNITNSKPAVSAAVDTKHLI